MPAVVSVSVSPSTISHPWEAAYEQAALYSGIFQSPISGIRNPPAGKPYKNDRPPSDYFKTNILVDSMGFNPIGLRAAVEMCGVDRVVFGSDYGPIPYGIKEHVQIVEDVLPSPADRELVFWKTSNKIFRLDLIDTDLITPTVLPAAA